MLTDDRVFLATSSAFGVMEGAIRNLVGSRCVNFCNGAFSDKWHDVTLRCGKQADAIRFDWGKPVTAEAVEKALATGKYDSMTMIHNETSTGVMSPLSEIADVMKKFPDVMFIVDTVSSMSAIKIPVAELGIDSCIFGVQKAFALPPGLTVFSASEKALKRASGIEGRGYYFDYIEFAANDDKNNTPSTPCISQIYAMDLQLERMFSEGLEKRWLRHQELAEYIRTWVTSHGFELFPEVTFCSQTLTCARNTRGIDLAGLKKKLAECGFAFDDGYGKIKGQTFRIAHMGDMTKADLDELLSAILTIMPELA
jgi:aspartate aminotransferase-like enzyme